MKKFNSFEFAKAVRVNCAILNVSLSDALRLLKIPKSTFYRVISGGATPDIESYYKVCEWLAVSMETFFYSLDA